MSTACAALTTGFIKNCDTKPVGGVESKGVLINKADYDAAVKSVDSTNPLILRTLTLAAGKKGYPVEVNKKNLKPKFETVDKENGVYYKHSASVAMPSWDSDTKRQAQALSENYFVLIVENTQKSGDAAFEVYGAVNGLRMPDGTRDLSANDGVFTGTLVNDEGSEEPNPPLSFAKTNGTPGSYDYTTTKTAFEALLVSAS